jgi:hypothetical protein
MTAQTILPANTLSSGDIITNSCKFDRASSDSFSKSMSDGSSIKSTFSAWVKVEGLGNEHNIMSHFEDTNNVYSIATSGSGVYINDYNSGYTCQVQTNRIMRDPSAWFHLCVIIDRSQGTAGNRNLIFINGVQETSLQHTTNYGQQTSGSHQDAISMNDGDCTMYIGQLGNGNQYMGGYLAEVVYLDGTAAAVTNFGEFDSDSPTHWVPKDVSGLSSSAGTNGFHLDFKDASNLGNDAFGGTDLTENNIAAGDQSTDTCQNNFCTLSPLYNVDGSYTLSEGNTQFLGTGGNDHTLGTLGVQGSGKWYFEAEFDTRSQGAYSGFADSDLANNLASDAAGVTVFIGMYRDDHTMQIGGGNEGAYTDVSDGDIFGFAMNLDANSGSRTVIVQKNGSTIDTVTIPTANEDNIFIPIAGDTSGTDSIVKMNFGGTPNPTPSSGVADANGHGSFEYNPTIGGVDYLAICTKNIAEFG